MPPMSACTCITFDAFDSCWSIASTFSPLHATHGFSNVQLLSFVCQQCAINNPFKYPTIKIKMFRVAIKNKIGVPANGTENNVS